MKWKSRILFKYLLQQQEDTITNKWSASYDVNNHHNNMKKGIIEMKNH